MHISVKGECAPGDIPKQNGFGHKMCMKRTFLREWRKNKPGRTLEQVAAELRISHQQLGRIERGVQPYNQPLLEFLADLYGCDESDLIMRPPGAKRTIEMVWDKIPEDQKEIALRILEGFAKTGTDGR